jgi:iron complex outermembrane receptor protein
MRQNLLLASAATVALVAGQAHAQAPAAAASDSQIQEVVVTAQKRAENIQNVPLSISSVSGDTLRTAGVTDPTMLQKLVPSLQINNTLFASGVIIRIRGFGSAANGATDSEVAAYLDGAHIARPGAILSSFLDVKNVEVLNGPQGTLFGRNATMGAISINTNAPSTTRRSVDLSAEGAKYGTYSGTGVVNVPVSNTFALRFAAKASHTDGDYYNRFDGQTYGRSNNLATRLSAKWDVAPNVSWTGRADLTKTTGDGAFPQTVYTSTASQTQLDALTAFVARNGGTPPVYSNDPSYTFNQKFTNPYNKDRQWGLTSDLSWNVTPALTFRLIDAYRNWHNNQQAGDTIATTLDMLAVHTATGSKSQSHELQLVSAKDAFLDHKLGITAGLYYFKEDYGLNTYFNLGKQFCSVVFGPRAPFLVPACQAAPQTNAGIALFTQSASSYAGYIQADYMITPTVELDLGARETSDKKTATIVNTTPNALGISAVEIPEGPEALSFKDSRPSFRASLSWHATDRVMFFGTYSTGYKSGGFNAGPASVVLTPAARTFASETVDDIELGAKSTLWDGRALLNVTLFNTALKNFQDRSFNGTAFVTRNSGDVRSRGVDIDGQIRPASNVTLTAGLTYLDSIYTNNPTAPGLEGCTGTPTCPLVQNLTDRPLGFAPKWQGNLGIEVKSGEFMGGYKAAVAGNEHLTSSFLTANTDNPQSRVPGYATTDLRLSFFSPDARWQLDFFGTNVFDKHYLVTTVAQVLGAVMGINNPATGATIYRGFLGDPARYGARISAKF